MHLHVKPGFGTPLQPDEYYTQVSAIILTLRPYSSLSTIARHLNANGFRSPTGKEFSKVHVANFIRSRQFQNFN